MHLFQLPVFISSGYDMGEIVRVMVNGKEAYRLDNRKEYAKSCKYKAKHGDVVIAFNKKQLHEFVRLCAEISKTKSTSQPSNAVRDWQDYAESHIDKEQSTIKYARR